MVDPRERDRLLALDAGLRAEADDALARSGIGAILSGAGYGLVGSYTMRTMAWRDLDFECYVEVLTIKEAVCRTPEYRRGILSVHVYEAVLEQGIQGLDVFLEWWSGRYGERQTGGRKQ